MNIHTNGLEEQQTIIIMLLLQTLSLPLSLLQTPGIINAMWLPLYSSLRDFGWGYKVIVWLGNADKTKSYQI